MITFPSPKQAHDLTQNWDANWSSRGKTAKALFMVFEICSGEKQQVLSEKENQIQSEKYNYRNFTKKEGFGGYVMNERDSKAWMRNIMLFFDSFTFREIEFGQSMYIKRDGPQNYLITSPVYSQNWKNLLHAIFLANVFWCKLKVKEKTVSLRYSNRRVFFVSWIIQSQTCTQSQV